MQHLPAHDVIDFLNDRCHSLARLQSSLANQVLSGGPTVAQHPTFIRDVIRVQEHRPRCEALLERLEAVSPDSNALPLLTQEMLQLDARIAVHLTTIREEPATLVCRLAKESVELLLELHVELERMMDDARQAA
jgi:hypothetical protein